MNEAVIKESKKEIRIWMIGLILLNLCLTGVLLPPGFILKTVPIGFVDFMQHYNHAQTFVDIFRTTGKTWGYNPSLMAGFPDLTVFDIDNKFVEWVALIGSFFGIKTAVSIKIILFIELLIEPFLLYFAFLNFGFRKKSCLWAVLGGILISNGPVGLFFNAGGMFSYMFATFFSTLVVSLYYRFLILQDKRFNWLMVILTALAPILHSVSVVMVGVPVLFMAVQGYKSLKKIMVKWLALSAAFALLVNIYWIIPVLKTFKYVISTDEAWTGSFSISQFAVFWIGGTILVSGGLFAVLYFVQGCKILRGKQKGLLVLSVLMVIVLIIAGGPGWYLIRSLQPNRFLILLQIYLLIPAIALLEQVYILKNIQTKKLMSTILITSLLLPALGMAFIRFAPPPNSIPLMIAHKLFGRKLEAGNLADPRTKELIQWLNSNTAPEGGRIMIEHPQGEDEESPYMTFYLGLLPSIHRYVKGEFIGAPRFEAPFVQNRDTRFSHDEMFGKKLSDISREELEYKLGLYNVRWIVAIKGTATSYLDRYTDLFEKVKEIDSAHIYEVHLPHKSGYFLKGDGRIKAEINRLELSDLQGDDIVIKYHWIDGFKASEGVRIERYPVEGDEAGFIRILRPPSNVVIYF